MAKDKEAMTAKNSKRTILKLKKKKLKGASSSDASEVNDSLSRSENNLGVFNDENVGEEAKVSKKAVKSKRKKQNLQLKGSPEKANTEKSSTESAHPIILEVGNGFKDTETQSEIAASHGNEEEGTGKRIKIKKVKKKGKSTKNDVYLPLKKSGLVDKHPKEVDDESVYTISSVDEDCSRGMKIWLLNYKESRPGLKILQQQIDEFIVTYEEQQEQERKEREERAAEGGWTVVVHHKGRKKTTDTESGITVGSVAQAAVLDNMTKKKSKEVPLNFYRFQKREAQRNEVMMLQQKFEQDKKRIQQLRAARKFRPY